MYKDFWKCIPKWGPNWAWVGSGSDQRSNNRREQPVQLAVDSESNLLLKSTVFKRNKQKGRPNLTFRNWPATMDRTWHPNLAASFNRPFPELPFKRNQFIWQKRAKIGKNQPDLQKTVWNIALISSRKKHRKQARGLSLSPSACRAKSPIQVTVR